MFGVVPTVGFISGQACLAYSLGQRQEAASVFNFLEEIKTWQQASFKNHSYEQIRASGPKEHGAFSDFRTKFMSGPDLPYECLTQES